MSNRIANVLITLTNTVLLIVGLFIGFRIILVFVSANPATPVVAWIYSVSSFLMSPFRGLVPNFHTDFGSLDIVALIALASYIIIAYLLTELFKRIALVLTEKEMVPTTVHYHELERDEDLEEEEKVSTHKRRRTR